MTSVADMYTIYLKPHHLPGSGCNVTIERVEAVELHPRPTETEKKLVLSFKGKRRRLILNQTNANKMADIGGEDYTAWPGLVIRIRPAKYTANQQTIVVEPAATNNK